MKPEASEIPGPQTHHVRIVSKPDLTAEVLIDGTNIAAHVSAVRVDLSAREVARVSFNVVAFDGVDFEGPAVLDVEPTAERLAAAIAAWLEDKKSDAGLEEDVMSRCLDVSTTQAYLDALIVRAKAGV
jgi:hypothetical protein